MTGRSLMNHHTDSVKNTLIKLFATFFYVGFFPLIPGSLASIVGALLAVVLSASGMLYLAVFVLISAAGFFVSGRMEKLTGEKDPSAIVIDEVAGALLAFFCLPTEPAVMITAFFLFRAFDMFKIYPADVMEKKHGGVGVMMDDIIAGIYTNLVMQAAVRLAGIV